ncbi:AAA family ATPase [Alicyclobacillaceae bacterium I2511]|nr:AAA family ATPase [Alicyclobacillaceae bacterium I2511]
MWTEQTLEHLQQMRLHGMVQALLTQQEQPDSASLSFEERLALLVDAEWSSRENHRLTRLLKAAHLKIPQACWEEVDYSHPRGLDKSLLRSFVTGQWMTAHHHILITGPTGVGKTYLTCALGNLACRLGHSAMYARTTRLLSELSMAKGDGTYTKLLAKLAKVEVLILDDFGQLPLTPLECHDLMEVIDDRNALHSTVVASQFPIDGWHQVMADPTLAEAILDRLVHNAYKIKLTGESMRKIQGLSPEKSNVEPE